MYIKKKEVCRKFDRPLYMLLHTHGTATHDLWNLEQRHQYAVNNVVIVSSVYCLRRQS